MEELSKKSSSERRRRLPKPSNGIDVNFCRNPQCDFFMEPPDPYDNRGKKSANVKPNEPRGTVGGSGDEKYFACGCCGRSTVIKNNKAIVEEYRRLRGRFTPEEPRDACSDFLCTSHGKSVSLFPNLYRKSGKTAKGDQRWKCKACMATFSVGSRIRRQRKSSQNNTILWMITNGVPISKIVEFTCLAPKDIYKKIDFIYQRVIDMTARREACFGNVSWPKVGRRFATDSQTLHLN